MKLRDYQIEAADAAMETFKEKRHEMLVLPTGTGKSLVIAEIANRINNPLIIICPTKEILEQNSEKLDHYNIEYGICSASMNKKEISNITLATPLTLSKPYYYKLLLDMDIKNIIIDECHLGTKVTNSKKELMLISKLVKEAQIDSVVGLTATPFDYSVSRDHGTFLRTLDRFTGRNENIFNSIRYVYQIEDTIKNNYWCDVTYDIVNTDTNVLELNSNETEYTKESIEEYYDYNTISDQIIDKVSNINNKSILIFVPSINNAEELSKNIPNSEVIHSKISKKKRKNLIKDFKDGKIRVMINVAVLTTGFDHPALDCVILARATNSINLYYQMIGRGIRPFGDKKCLVIDYSGNYNKFGNIADFKLNKYGKKWELFMGDRQITSVKLGDINENPHERLTFGKFKGEKVSDVDINYLKWIKKEIDEGKEFKSITDETLKLILDRC